MTNGLSIQNLELRAGGDGHVLMSDVNVVAEESRLIALVGLNGTGKSTLLNCVGGMFLPSKGKITINNEKIHSLTAAQRSKVISIVFTSQDSTEWLDVYTYLTWARAPHTGRWNHLSQEDLALIDEIIDITGIFPLKNRFLHQLSDGEKQRCRIARALVQDTPLILLDEPTAFLDIRNKNQVMELLKNLAVNRKKTILLSTHDIAQAKKSADEIWWVDEKRLKSVPPAEFNEEYLY